MKLPEFPSVSSGFHPAQALGGYPAAPAMFRSESPLRSSIGVEVASLRPRPQERTDTRQALTFGVSSVGGDGEGGPRGTGLLATAGGLGSSAQYWLPENVTKKFSDSTV